MKVTRVPLRDVFPVGRRVQHRRGVALPPNTLYVGRPTLFGNPWALRDAVVFEVPKADRQAWLVRRYRDELTHLGMLSDYGDRAPRRYEELVALGLPTMADYARYLLRGYDLACSCQWSRLCHVDVLLELMADG